MNIYIYMYMYMYIYTIRRQMGGSGVLLAPLCSKSDTAAAAPKVGIP